MKILVLSSVYRDNSLGNRDTSTNVVNLFANEWVKQGHEVIVIHNSHRYPIFIHLLPIFIKRKLASYLNFQIADYDAVNHKTYKDSGVVVCRLPIKKIIPHGSPSKRKILVQVKKITKYLEKNHFIPDVITGHWASPQMEIIYYLKDLYKCKTAIVLHGTGYVTNSNFDVFKYLTKIDKIGCRSLYQSKFIREKLKLNKLPFVCYSGVPNQYLNNYKLNLDKFNNTKVWKIIYVGRLVSYKNVDVIIKSLSQIEGVNWELNIVGEGTEMNNLKKLSDQLNCYDKVRFLGKISRDEVLDLMSKMHIYVMVSTNEVFGLAYLEAMASSCITIASKNGGVDGIIKDGINGFLCVQENVDDLRNKLNYIFNMNKEEIKKISKLGYETIQEYSDSLVAKKYLDIISKK